MAIALDARWLKAPLHGIARYTLNLLQGLPHQPLWILYNRADFDPALAPRRADAIWIDCRVPLFGRNEPWAMTRLLRRLRPQVLHVPAYWMPYAAPCPWLLTVHDLIHLDEAGFRYRAYYAWLRRRLRRGRLITVSQASAARLRDWCGQPAAVTYPGVGAAYAPADGPLTPELRARGVTEPYFLFVGNAKPHKRFDLALAASARLERPHQLVSVGVPASGQAGHLALNRFPEALMPALYRGATALLLPSRDEGFGLPGAEATACACPVLASDLPVLREVVPAARHLPPQAESWAAAMARLLESPPPRAGLLTAAAAARERFACARLGVDTAALYADIGRAA